MPSSHQPSPSSRFPTIEDFFAPPPNATAESFTVPTRPPPSILQTKTISRLVPGDLGVELVALCVGVYRAPTGQHQRSDHVTLWLKDETGLLALHVEGRQVSESEVSLGRLLRVTDPLVRGSSAARKGGHGNNKVVLPALSAVSIEVKDQRGRIEPVGTVDDPIDKKFLAVLAPQTMKPVSLREIVGGKTAERAFVQVLSVGEIKRTAKGLISRNVDVSDGELVLSLCLWRSQTEMASRWQRRRTVLLLTNPKVSVFGGNVQLSLGYQSLVEVIEGPEAELMRSFSSMLASQQITPPESDDHQPSPTKPIPRASTSQPIQQTAQSFPSNLVHATINDLACTVSSFSPQQSNKKFTQGYTVAVLVRIDREEDNQTWLKLMDDTGTWTLPKPDSIKIHELQVWARYAIEWNSVVQRSHGNGAVVGLVIEPIKMERATGIMKMLCEAAACSL